VKDTTSTEIIAPASIIENLSNEDFNAKLRDSIGILIDVRTAEEYAAGHIPNAINLDYSSGEFAAAIDTLDTSVPVLVYCQGGVRSGKARDLLAEKNFEVIFNLTNGYGQWEK
jgi:rhodanese-related sulfurtransferase